MSSVIQNIERHERGITVRLTGEIDLQQSPDFHQTLVGLCAEKPARLIVVMSDVNYMDSSGVGSLVEIFRRLKRSGGTLVLVSPSERVRSVLEITKLDQFFIIVATEQEAGTQ